MQKCHGEVILASGKSYSYRSIAENIQEIIPCKIIEKERSGAKVDHSYSNAKLKKMIGDYYFKLPYITEQW